MCNTGSAEGNKKILLALTPSRRCFNYILHFKGVISAFGVQRRRAAVQRFRGQRSRNLQGDGARIRTRPGLAKVLKGGEVTVQ
jgi:hypothetical protein